MNIRKLIDEAEQKALSEGITMAPGVRELALSHAYTLQEGRKKFEAIDPAFKEDNPFLVDEEGTLFCEWTCGSEFLHYEFCPNGDVLRSRGFMDCIEDSEWRVKITRGGMRLI